MNVIFIKDSEHGKLNQVKDVADGLAKNLLIKKGFAIPATTENLAILKRKQAKEFQEQKDFELKVNEMIALLKKEPLSIYRKSNSLEKIQGSLTSEDISKEIKSQLGLDIDKKMIIADKINRFGLNAVIINFGHSKKCVLEVLLFREN